MPGQWSGLSFIVLVTDLGEGDVAILEGVGKDGGALADNCVLANLQELIIHHIQAVDKGAVRNLGSLHQQTAFLAPSCCQPKTPLHKLTLIVYST